MLSLCICVLPDLSLLSLHVEPAFLPRHMFLSSGEASATRIPVSAARLQDEIWHCRAPQGNHTRLIDGKARERFSETRSSRESYRVVGGKARARELLKLQSQKTQRELEGSRKNSSERARERTHGMCMCSCLSACPCVSAFINSMSIVDLNFQPV